MSEGLMCPQCAGQSMVARGTTTGVELDACDKCGSVWFDRGELFFFVEDVGAVSKAVNNARSAASMSDLKSPNSGEIMVNVTLDKGQHGYLDRSNGGVWLPGSAVHAVTGSHGKALKWLSPEAVANVRRFKMPNLFARTFFTLAGLYALLSFILITVSLAGGLSPKWALLIALGFGAVQFLIGPFIMDLMVRYAYQARWVGLSELPQHLQEFVKKTCHEHDMAPPRFAIIPDLSPNAFTYGHTPNNSRLVLTEGTLELLEPQELHGVVGHEMGHARNWDMALMTLAQLVPMILFYIYRTLINLNVRDGRVQAASRSVAIGAYVLYIISEYIVLWFSRTREYHADRFGAQAAGSAAALGRALVKIAYGLAGRTEGAAQGGKTSRKASAIGAMGIFDAGSAQSLSVLAGGSQNAAKTETEVVTSEPQKPRYGISSDDLKGAMKWDLWNPWATWFELHSTHPLVAKRLLHLCEISMEMGEEPLVRFDLPQPESYWDEFLVDIAVKFLPALSLIVTATLFFMGMMASSNLLGICVLGVGIAMFLKHRFRYPTGNFPEMSVSTLLRQVKVSDIRPVPCRLEGTVRGRGVPGLVWSDDFVMQDDTGIIFLDHRQPLSIWETIWGWLRGDKLVGGHVVVEGWYRRAPMPFVEIKKFTVDGTTRRSYLHYFRAFGALVIIGLGLLLTFAPASLIAGF